MKNVLILSSDLSITGGIPRYTKYQINVLKTLGFEVSLITGYKIGDFFKAEEFKHIYTLNLNHGERLNILNKIMLIINSLLSTKNLTPDLILTNHISLFPLAYLINKSFRIPYIANIYGAELWTNPKYLGLKSLKEANAVIADSKNTLKYAVKNLGLDKNKVFLIYDPVDTARFKPMNINEYEYIYEKYKLPKGKKIILTLSRLDRFKGHEIIIDLIDRFDEEVIYVIGGTGAKENYLKQMCLAKGVLGKKVFFAGKVEESDLSYFYNVCDVFVLISKKEHGEGEGLPLSLIEASACGKPIIVGNEDGSREAVIYDKNGFTVSPRDNNEVFKKLKMLLQDDKLRHEMGTKGREIVCDLFSYENFEKNHIKILDNFFHYSKAK
jgi:phosphatidylinositol alpha-1,6-mannosyltransferase